MLDREQSINLIGGADGEAASSSREAGVVTVVVRESRLIFVTVEWIEP
jgi:hypothetical protein